jgi:type 1 glutamine amidotransferase
MKRVMIISVVGVVLAAASCSPNAQKAGKERMGPIKVVVVTAGHEFEHDAFFTLFQGYDDIEYVEKEQKDQSEIFEDISGWDYDVVVLYNMTDGVSEKRRQNFLKLLDDGVGVVALHHSIASFQYWPEYKKIIGWKFYLKKTREDGVLREKGGYQHDVDNGQSFEADNVVLLTTDQPLSDKTLCSVRKYANANICCIQPGHGTGAFNDPNYRRLVAQAIRWCAGRSE